MTESHIASTEVLLSTDVDGVRTLTLNRPKSYNSLTVELKERLLSALREAGSDDKVRAVVLTGAGRAFCAGQDLKQHAELLRANDPAPLRTVSEHYNPIVRAITELPKPVIAAVNGPAAGAGAGFAYACDLRIAGASANFLMAFASVGLGPDSGASWTLPRLVGHGKAMELMLLAQPVNSAEALRLGLVSEVVPDDELAEKAHLLAARLAAGPTTTYAQIKKTLWQAGGSTFHQALIAEDSAQQFLGSTTEHREAVAAFLSRKS
jgi:2-(1,2-epoxy-1,2-dihydrophenyl)acetyl-CoA isomerase